MKDLSHINVPAKITVSGAFSMMPQSELDKLSDKSHTDEAARLMGVADAKEEVPDGGSE